MAESRLFSDLSLTFSPHPVKKDITVLYDDEAIKASLKTLLLTNHYERLFHPELGCNLTAQLFENINPVTAINISNIIENTIKNHEPRVNIVQLEVNVAPDENAYSVYLEFTIVNRPDPLVFEFMLERLR